MWCLLAEQTPNLATVQPSGNFSNPDSWANLARAIGVPAFLGLVILLLIAAGVFFVARWTVGPQGWAKRLAESFIDGLLGKLDSLNTSEQKQLERAKGAKGDILHCLLLERTEADKIGIWRERHEHRSAEFATMCSIGAMDGRLGLQASLHPRGRPRYSKQK